MLIEINSISNIKGEVSFSKYGVDRKDVSVCVCVCIGVTFTADCR